MYCQKKKLKSNYHTSSRLHIHTRFKWLFSQFYLLSYSIVLRYEYFKRKFSNSFEWSQKFEKSAHIFRDLLVKYEQTNMKKIEKKVFSFRFLFCEIDHFFFNVHLFVTLGIEYKINRGKKKCWKTWPENPTAKMIGNK